jgi:formylglycine-generating enzyme
VDYREIHRHWSPMKIGAPESARPGSGTLLMLAAVALVPLSAQGGPRETAGPGQHPQLTVFKDFLATGRPCPYCPEMATIPGGRFLMGSLPGEGHNDEHGPDGRPFGVSIPGGLAFSVGEITRREFAAYLDANPHRIPPPHCAGLVNGAFSATAGDGWKNPGFEQGDTHPVVCVSWGTAKGYTAWLTRITGQQYRLPTEAEWEYAARAGSRARFWWGEAMLPDRVNCIHEWCDTRFAHTAPVRSFRSNPFGLYDLPGNVWEWTEDCYDALAYRSHAAAYPAPMPGPANCNRVIRGGSWTDGYWSLRSANREGWKSATPLNDIGFRVVRVGGGLPL